MFSWLFGTGNTPPPPVIDATSKKEVSDPTRHAIGHCSNEDKVYYDGNTSIDSSHLSFTATSSSSLAPATSQRPLGRLAHYFNDMVHHTSHTSIGEKLKEVLTLAKSFDRDQIPAIMDAVEHVNWGGLDDKKYLVRIFSHPESKSRREALAVIIDDLPVCSLRRYSTSWP